ncbi:UV radiation resistance-associated protein-like [Homalodisca vitripennis]|uniref:UV radiation resistance-associated protein-like n=1 Tax=Homalodisca vitripennis TaxID=197043 RepID=UPI001EEA887C|nr:UV radiation resistance-associated protein-like [Homalodisca vitripennis]
MSIVSPRATLRWKEWIPLVTQQQRLRNLLQIIAYNINPYEKCPHLEKSTRKNCYYYTLHLTTMSAPFYTSEKLESDNPKWADVEINQVNGAANGVVIRVWCHPSDGSEQMVTVWGVYFSGLSYLGPRLVGTDPSQFKSNTIVFHMQGGYFTAPHCFKEARPASRVLSAEIPVTDIRPSYSVSLLLRLHSIQQAIKQHSVAAASLRERISDGGLGAGETGGESAMLRRLLHRTRAPAPPPHHHQLAAMRRELEEVRFRVSLLTHERDKKSSQIRQKIAEKNRLVDENQDRDRELMERYRVLHKEVERLKELKRLTVDVRDNLYSTTSMLQTLRRKRIAELNIIYPISQMGDDKFAICGVHLPNSEDFAGHDEVMISVALGFVAHLIQMIAYFLHIPLRYPILHAGSRSRVIDHITEKIPDKEREFPLYSRGKEKLQFNYGVYLLNKNIAQLRWYCNLVTQDLRTTLPNLLALLNLKPGHNTLRLEASKRALSSSELQGVGVRLVSPPSARYRTKSANSPLSYSLDKGLDQLDRCAHHMDPPEAAPSSEDDGQREFLHSWAAQGPAPTGSDVDDPATNNGAETLASFINKMNSPIVVNRVGKRTEDDKTTDKDKSEENGSNNAFQVHETIRQVTSRHSPDS